MPNPLSTPTRQGGSIAKITFYMRQLLQQFLIVLLLNLSLVLSLTQAQTLAPTQQQEKIVPNDYPKFMDTGNPQTDNARYNAAKQAWIAANPQAYAKMMGQLPAVKTENKVEDKGVATPEKPNEMIPPYKPLLTTNVPAETANVLVEQSISADSELLSPKLDRTDAQSNTNHGDVSGAANYPTTPTTGNVAADEKAHIEAKNNWIKTHPEEYRKAGGNPEAVLEMLYPKETAKIEKPKVVLPPFDAQRKYKLMVYEAVAAENQKVSPAQLKAETENITQKDFIGTGTELQVNINNNQIRLYQPEKIDLRATEKRNGNKVEWFFENKECASCSKTLYLTIEQESDQAVSYIMQSEDEGDIFAYRLSFQLITKP